MDYGFVIRIAILLYGKEALVHLNDFILYILPVEYLNHYETIKYLLRISTLIILCLLLCLMLYNIYMIDKQGFYNFIKRTFSRSRGEPLKKESVSSGTCSGLVEDEYISVVTIYVVDVVDFIENNNGGKCITLNKCERPVKYNDRECIGCGKRIHALNRRVFHDNGAECYVCFRKRIDSRKRLVFFFAQQLPFDNNRDIALYLCQIYLSLQREHLQSLIDYVPIGSIQHEYALALSLFPSLEYPYFCTEAKIIQFSFYHPDHSIRIAHYFNIYLDDCQRHITVTHWKEISVTENFIIRDHDYVCASIVEALRRVEKERDAIDWEAD